MGVKWLTSFVKNVERAVSSPLEFGCKDQEEEEKSVNGSDEQRRPLFVVDAWAFIFHVWLNKFGDAIRSHDTELYQELVREIVRAWIRAGIDVTFVFDGPFLPTKIDTLVKRRADIVAGTLTYMRSSAQSRTSPRFQASCGIIPPLMHSATAAAVRSLQSAYPSSVQLVFAPTEADSLVAELAAQHDQGYALSQDSDYFILCSRGKGCAGYVPFDSVEFVIDPKSKSDIASKEFEAPLATDEPDDGFQVVNSKKKRRGAMQQIGQESSNNAQRISLFPPLLEEKTDSIVRAIRIQAYKAHDLAAYLQIPPNLLPLLAAIVGNDYTTALQSRVLLNHLSVPQKIPTVAERLRVEWLRLKNENRSTAGVSARRALANDFDDANSEMGSSATATPTRATTGAIARSAAATIVPNDPVRTMVNAIVTKLLSQADTTNGPSRYLSTGEHEMIVDSIIDSAATYSLLTHTNAPHLASPSATFFGDAIALLAGRMPDRIARPDALKLYRQAYEAGHFREALIEIVSQRILLTRTGPEDPDIASAQTSTARAIRSWLYAVLFEVWGMSWARDTWEDPAASEEGSSSDDSHNNEGPSVPFYIDRSYKEGEQPDDVISVDTESSASELGGISENDEDSLPSRPGSALGFLAEERKSAPGVNEYVRFGTSYTPQLVRIVPLWEMLHATSTSKALAGNDEMPASLSSLLAQHEASQGAGDGKAPQSDPVPSPVVLQPISVRLDYFLFAMGAYTSSVRALPVSLWLPAACLRAILVAETQRLSPNRLRYNWSPKEIAVAVSSMIPAGNSEAQIHESLARCAELHQRSAAVFPSTRAIHFASQIQLILDTATMLAQSLLLPVDEAQWSAPHACFSGIIFHDGMFGIHNAAATTSTSSSSFRTDNTFTHAQEGQDADLLDKLQNAVVEGYHDKLGIDEADLRQERKAQKAKKREQKIKAAATADNSASAGQGTDNRSTHQQSGRNPFAALLEEDS